MRALLINVVCGIGSTGRICVDLAREYEAKGYEVRIAYGRDPVPQEVRKYAVRIGSDWDVRVHGILTRLFDIHGTGPASRGATKRFLKWAEDYNPDLLWLHNLHGYYLNYELLFAWIKRRQQERQAAGRPLMEIKWTLHDCWAFTGHCSHFMACGCEKWKAEGRSKGIGCTGHCPEKGSYPACYGIGRSADNYTKKLNSFTDVPNLQIITPSQWMSDLVGKGFLRNYPLEVVYNKIDTGIFKPTPSDVRDRLGIGDKKMLLGVSSIWTDKKGLSDYLRLAEMVDDNVVIVLVGLDPNEKQAQVIRERIVPDASRRLIFLPKTNNQRELAELYTTADLYLNFSKEESFGLTTIESIACGTPVVVYGGTACEEVVKQVTVIIGEVEITAIRKLAMQRSIAIDNIEAVVQIIEKIHR